MGEAERAHVESGHANEWVFVHSKHPGRVRSVVLTREYSILEREVERSLAETAEKSFRQNHFTSTNVPMILSWRIRGEKIDGERNGPSYIELHKCSVPYTVTNEGEVANWLLVSNHRLGHCLPQTPRCAIRKV